MLEPYVQHTSLYGKIKKHFRAYLNLMVKLLSQLQHLQANVNLKDIFGIFFKWMPGDPAMKICHLLLKGH